MKKFFLQMLLAAETAMAGDGGFLFVTFKGEQSPMTEQIYFALSKDGRKWDAMNWASTTKRDDFAKHRIWAARTKDFRKFGEAFIYIEKPTTIIDTTIVRSGDKYFRFSKDEKFKAITMEFSDKLTGKWAEVPGFSLAQLRGYEGPECYQVEAASDGKQATWCLILDQYSKSAGYQPFISKDLAGGQFTPGEGFSFPFHFRHGSILPLSKQEYSRLEAAFNKPKR
jgi:hypothetical protein